MEEFENFQDTQNVDMFESIFEPFEKANGDKYTAKDTFNTINLGYRFEKFEINLWVRNLFDETYETRGFYFGLIPPDFEDELFKSYGDPRQMGVSLNYQVLKNN